MASKTPSIKLDGIFAKGIIRCLGPFHQIDPIKDKFCVYCGGPANTWEHVIPRSLGGGEGHYNRVRACSECNGARGSKPFIVWMIKRGITLK